MTADKPWRQIPSVNEILAEPAVEEILRSWPRERVVEAVRDVTASIRRILAQEASDNEALGLFSSGERVAAAIRERLEARSLRRVINATGVVLHTNLGRASLPQAAREALAEAAFHNSNLEFDLETGVRGSRYSHVASLLTRITGAEAALVVNNNAAAVLLCLETLAAGREVILSRGELVEIGGSFRVPDVMARSGARLVEVGTTNKTHFRDYQEAITENTGLLLKVHTSNYRIVGFVEEVSLEEMARLGKQRGLPVMDDLGSGVLVDLAPYGLPHEPTVQEAVKTGADLVTFSGDKLLGGPQAGIIVGRADLVARIAQNPLTRALRIDKMTLAALEATLRLYLAPEAAVKQIPTLARLTEPLPAVEERARRLADLIRGRLGDRVGVEVVRDDAEAGGGSLPTFQIPSAAAAVDLLGRSLEQAEAALRRQKPAVIGHLQKERLLFNARTLEEDELTLVAEALAKSLEVEG